MEKVKIYTSPSCHFCHTAKDFFNENSIEFEEFDVTDPEKREELVKISGQIGVPLIIIGEENIIGFDEARIKEALGI